MKFKNIMLMILAATLLLSPAGTLAQHVWTDEDLAHPKPAFYLEDLTLIEKTPAFSVYRHVNTGALQYVVFHDNNFVSFLVTDGTDSAAFTDSEDGLVRISVVQSLKESSLAFLGEKTRIQLPPGSLQICYSKTTGFRVGDTVGVVAVGANGVKHAQFQLVKNTAEGIPKEVEIAKEHLAVFSDDRLLDIPAEFYLEIFRKVREDYNERAKPYEKGTKIR